MTIDELRESLRVKTKEARSLTEKDKLDEEGKGKLDNLLTEIEETRSDIERMERLEAVEDYGKRGGDVSPDEKPELDGEKEERSVKAGARREAQRKYRNIAEQILDIRSAQFNKGDVGLAKERLEFVADEERSISGLGTTVPSDGGYLVQKDFSEQILSKAHDTSKLPGRCRQVTISNSSNGIKVPYLAESSRADGSRAGGVRGYWTAEGDSTTASNPKLGMLELNLHKLRILSYLTDELMADAPAMASILMTEAPREIGFKFDDAIINGDGAGKPLGLLNANCKVEVAKESEQAADTILWENVVQMFSQLWSGSGSSAEWYINQNILPQLYTMTQTVGSGGVPVYLPPGGASRSPYGELMGRPVNIIEQAQTLGDAGDIILADLKEYYWATKGNIESASSIHVRFLYDETTLRWVVRVDGQPAWANSLTPYNDASTSEPVSPIVTLEARA